MHQARYQAERGVKGEPGVKSEKIKLERGMKKRRDEEYEAMVASAVVKKAKTRPFEPGETIDLD